MALAVLLTACAAGVHPSTPGTTAVATSAAASPMPSQLARVLTFDLNPAIGQTVGGSVEVDIAGSGYAMTVQIHGLNPKSRHLLNIHAGSCAEQDTELMTVFALGVQADEAGDAMVVKTFPRPYEIPPAGRILTVHGDDPEENRSHIACAELTE